MPVDVIEPVASPVSAPLGMRLLPASSGWVELNPRFRERLAAQGLLTAEAFLALPGEIVSGHPDRHVVFVENLGFLKRQHHVGWRERLRQKFAGFGWSSRCTREGRLLRLLEREGLPCPQWIAFGEDGQGRAFLLVEELPDAVNLRQLLSDTGLSLADRTRLAEKLGQAVAELHAAGFDTPDLAAKHVFANPESFAITLLDWQSARRTTLLGSRERMRSLAALDASLADSCADRRTRLRFLWAYSRVARRSGFAIPGFSKLVREISRLSMRAQQRRSIRDQRQTPVTQPNQRLIWLAGEAVCAIPEIAAAWPKPAITAPYYSDATPADETIRVQLPDGREASLARGRSFAPIARLLSALRGKTWRSPGVTIGRVLFHLQRYGIPAPQLYAFGQRDNEWFALYEPPTGKPLGEWLASTTDASLRREVLEQARLLLEQLHDSGCRIGGREELFWVSDKGRVMLGGIRAVRFAKRVTTRQREADRRAILGSE